MKPTKKHIKQIAMSALISASITGSLFCVNQMATAHAQPFHTDTVGEVARQICSSLDRNPTVANMNVIVNQLLGLYTEQSENEAMYAAMHQVCPEYQYIATEAMKEAIQNQQNPPIHLPPLQQPNSQPNLPQPNSPGVIA